MKPQAYTSVTFSSIEQMKRDPFYKRYQTILDEELAELEKRGENLEQLTVRVRFVEKTFNGKKYVTVNRIDFETRET